MRATRLVSDIVRHSVIGQSNKDSLGFTYPMHHPLSYPPTASLLYQVVTEIPKKRVRRRDQPLGRQAAYHDFSIAEVTVTLTLTLTRLEGAEGGEVVFVCSSTSPTHTTVACSPPHRRFLIRCRTLRSSDKIER